MAQLGMLASPARFFHAGEGRVRVPAWLASHRNPKFVVEVDGSQHTQRATQDASRTRVLAEHGYTVVRFWDNEVLQDIDGVLRRLPGKSRGQHWRPHPPLSHVEITRGRGQIAASCFFPASEGSHPPFAPSAGPSSGPVYRVAQPSCQRLFLRSGPRALLRCIQPSTSYG